MTQQYCLASLSSWLSSSSISHHRLLPHIPSICLSIVNSGPCSGIAPQSPNSSSQPLRLPGNQCSSLGYVWLWQGLIVILFRVPLISCFTLGLKCFSSDSDNCPNVGIGPLLQFPRLLRASPVLLTLLFFPLVPLSYKVLSGSIYSFPLLRYSCPPSAGILHALLCLKVYFWGIHGQRYNPCPPTPPPSSYLPERSFKVYNLQKISFKYINSS